MRQLTTLQRQRGWHEPVAADADVYDDDLFVDGDERRKQRLLSIGSVKPEPLLDTPRTALAAIVTAPREPQSKSQTNQRRSRRPQAPAWVWALLGFIVGIGFWHAIGFWTFISQVVLPPVHSRLSSQNAEPAALAVGGALQTRLPSRPARARLDTKADNARSVNDH